MSATARTIADVVRGFPRPAPGVAGDAGMFGPGSMVWRIHREGATILGGGRALLMQVAHPMVAAGVADHSDYSVDPFVRLWRTLEATLTVSFGDSAQALAAADRVRRVHERVVGERAGQVYRALDPDLLLWVHATLVDSALVTYERYVRPLSPAARDRYYQEMKRFAAAFGLADSFIPPELADLERYLSQMLDGLRVSEEARRIGAGILRPPAPVSLRPVRWLLEQITIDLLPPPLRDAFGLAWSSGREGGVRALAAGARLALPLTPARLRFWPHALESAERVRLRE